jgi:hypothetical protein
MLLIRYTGLLPRLAAQCLLGAVVLLGQGGIGFAAERASLEIPAELWDRPRTGRAVMAVPAVQQAVTSLLARSEARLVIRHTPGPDPTLQAEELRAWLAAHAVEPRRIVLRADLPARQLLLLEIVN